MKKIVVIGVTLLILLMSACAGGSSAQVPAIEGIRWLLVGIGEKAPVAGSQVTLLLEDGQVSGNTGCNSYGGSYQVDGVSITISDLYSTEMACQEPAGVMQQEGEFLDILRNSDRLELAGGRFTVFSTQGDILNFEAQELAGPTEPTTPGPETTPTSTPPSTVANLPPAGFKEYVDETAGVSISIPESWFVTGVIEGQYAILQSYPEDKYVGGEARQPGDTKCDLSRQVAGVGFTDILGQWEADSITTVISQEEITLGDGQQAMRFELNTMGPATVLLAEYDNRVVTLTCFGDVTLFDQIASTLRESE